MGRVRPKMEYDDRGNTKMVYTEYLETEDQKKNLLENIKSKEGTTMSEQNQVISRR